MMRRLAKSSASKSVKDLRFFQSESHFQPFGNRHGPPGRSANSGITATVFGAYGFVGRYFLSELGLHVFSARFQLLLYDLLLL